MMTILLKSIIYLLTRNCGMRDAFCCGEGAEGENFALRRKNEFPIVMLRAPIKVCAEANFRILNTVR